MFSDSVAISFYCDREACEAERRHRTVGPNEVIESYVLQRAMNRYIDALPGATDAAYAFVLAIAVERTALGYRYGTFQRIDNIGSAYMLGAARQPVATIRTTRRRHESCTCQGLEQFADGGQANARRLGNVGGTANGSLVRRQVGEQDRSIVGQFADSEHGRCGLNK